MRIDVAWYDHKYQTLLLTFPEMWDWETFTPAFQQTVRLACQVPYPVDVIIDMQQVYRLPPHTLNHVVRVAAHWRDNFGRVVFVTDHLTLLPFAQAARNIIPRARRQAHHTATIAQAAALLQAQRSVPAVRRATS